MINSPGLLADHPILFTMRKHDRSLRENTKSTPKEETQKTKTIPISWTRLSQLSWSLLFQHQQGYTSITRRRGREQQTCTSAKAMTSTMIRPRELMASFSGSMKQTFPICARDKRKKLPRSSLTMKAKKSFQQSLPRIFSSTSNTASWNITVVLPCPMFQRCSDFWLVYFEKTSTAPTKTWACGRCLIARVVVRHWDKCLIHERESDSVHIALFLLCEKS